MRNLLFVIPVVSYLLGTPQAISACSCRLPPPPLEALARADVVFAGTVIEVDEHPLEILERGDTLEFPLSPFRTKFKVDRPWKGVDGEETIVITQELTTCEYRFELGKDYLVYGYLGWINFSDEEEEAFVDLDLADGEFLQTSICRRTRLLAEAPEDLEALGRSSFTLVKPTVWGQIKAMFY